MCNCEKTEYGPPPRHSDGLAGQLTNKGRPKYYDILEAVEHLVEARRGVQVLCDQIVGVSLQPDDKGMDKKPEKKPSLLDVLDNMPAKISQEVDMIHGAVNEIRAQIL